MNNLTKSPFLKAILVGALLIGASLAQARYAVMDYQKSGMDPHKRTHILVAGKGSDMGLQFHMSAAAQARKIMDVNPNDQVVLVAVLDDGRKSWLSSSEVNELRRMEMSLVMMGIVNSDNADDVRRYGNKYTNYYSGGVIEGTKTGLQQWGFTNIQEFSQDLDGKELVNIIAQFNRVASLNIYSHSTAYYGLILDGPMKRLDPKEEELMKTIASHFTDDAYAWLHGCNNGILGMQFTSKWNIPVATSFTSTAFQELFRKADGSLEFIHAYDQNVPTGAKRMGVNSISYAKTQECRKVPCVRMMPDNYGYNGYWGNFKDGGLGFYKFNCSSRVGDSRCKLGMAIGMINQISPVFTNYQSDLDSFKKAAAAHLCPTGTRYIKPGYTFESCAQTLEASLTKSSVTLNTFLTKPLQCDRRSCQASITCDAIPGVDLLIQKSCTIKNRYSNNQPVSTQVQEYRDLVEGFKLLKSRSGK